MPIRDREFDPMKIRTPHIDGHLWFAHRSAAHATKSVSRWILAAARMTANERRLNLINL
jgi:hypothetical protein